MDDKYKPRINWYGMHLYVHDLSEYIKEEAKDYDFSKTIIRDSRISPEEATRIVALTILN